jgi:hypothetical protein
MSAKKQSKSRRDFLKSGALAGSMLMLPGLKNLAASLGELENHSVTDIANPLALGLLDVTKAPYNADPTGMTDATAAIQLAVYAARDQRLICFFPSGTYLVSDTIDGEIPVYKLPVGAVIGSQADDGCGRFMATDGKTQHYWNDTNDRVIMLGSTNGPRPVLKLAPGATGFQNPGSPKLVVKIWAQTRHDRAPTALPIHPTV